MSHSDTHTTKKVAIIGAGNVGTVAAYCMARTNVAEVALVDVVPDMPHAKARGLARSAALLGFRHPIVGSNDYAVIKDADVVIHTAGLPRKPGMDRMDLLKTNVKIAQSAGEAIVQFAPRAVVLVVANPLDIIAMTLYRTTGFSKERVLGMAGVLDATRFRYFVAERLQVWPGDVNGLVLGGHGDSMVPLPQYTTVGGIPLTEFMSAEEIEELAARTRVGGGEIVGHLKFGGAYYAPGASAAAMAESMVNGVPRVEPASAYLTGQYGLSDMYLGVPALIDSGGIARIIEIPLNDQQLHALHHSAKQVQKGLELLNSV